MNDRNLAIKISKHPLLRRLMEDRTISKSIVTRLIVEELLEQEQKGSLFSALAGVNRDKKSPENFLKSYLNNGQPVYKYAKLNDLTPKQQAAYKEVVDGFIQAFSQQAKPETKQQGEKQQKATEEKLEQQSEQEIANVIKNAENVEQLQNLNTKIQSTPDEEVSPETKEKVKKAAEKKGKELQGQQENPYKDMPGYKELNLKPEEETVFVSFLNKLREKNIIKEANLTQLGQAIGTGRGLNDVIKSFEGDSRKILFKLLRRDDILNFIKSAVQPESTDENPYSKLEGYKELNLKPEEETVFISFLDKLKQSNIIKEANLTTLGQMIGTKRGLNQILKSFQGDDKKILFRLLRRDDVQAFIQKNLSNISEPQEKPGSSDPGEQLPIEQENVKPFLDSADNFLKEFYRQKYKIKQAGFIKAVLDALGGMVEDENLAKAAQRVPDKKPKEEPQSDEAATEEEPEETKPPEQAQQDLQEQEEEKQASKDEMRNLRIGMNSLIKRINWSRKALDKFQETAGKGSVLADADKKNFIKVLEEIQMSIKRICLVLQQILKDSEKLNEQEESEVIKQWKEIQKKYNLASEAISNLAELLKPGGVSEIPKMLTNDAYSALIDLAGHFPSVAPFGQGKENRKDFAEYDAKFNNAITKVKDDLQNVFSLMKTGQAGEESLILALDGLKEFSAQIQAIFGVASKFEELKIEPNEEAAEGEPEGDIDDMPRDLPTQLKDLLDEYEGRYKKVKAVLDDPRDLFKESIGDEFQQLKKAFLQSAGMLSLYIKNGRSILDSAGKKNMAKPEVIKSFRTAMEYFVSLYEELQEMYKKITDNPSVLEKIWRAITPKINKFKQHIKKIIDDILAPLDRDLDLQPGDIPGTEAPEVEVEEDFTEEISQAENSFEQLFSLEKFQDLGGDPKFYDVFMKMVLIIYSKSQINEVNIGSINAPLTRSAPTGMFDQAVLQNKLKKLAQTNEALVREISEMLADISTNKMKPLLEFVAQNKNKIVSLDFDAILSDAFMSAAAATKAKKAVKDIKTASNLNTLLSQKTSAVNRMVGFLEKETKSKAKAIKIKDALIIWYMMINSSAPQSVKEQEEKSRYDKKNRFIKDVFVKIPAAYRKAKRMDRGKILKIKRNLRMYDVDLDTVISTAHYKISQTILKKVYEMLDEIFKGVKISTVMNKAGISKLKNGLVTKETDDSLLDSDDLGLTPEEEKVIKDESEKSVKNAQDQNKDGSPQEIADAAAEEAMSSPGVKKITADMTGDEKQQVSDEIKRQSQEELQNQSGAGAKKEYEQAVRIQFKDEEIEILEELINFKISITENQLQQDATYYFKELFGEETFKKFKQKFEGFIGTLDEKRFEIIGDLYADRIKPNRDAHKRFKKFFRNRMESQQSSDAPEKPAFTSISKASIEIAEENLLARIPIITKALETNKQKYPEFDNLNDEEQKATAIFLSFIFQGFNSQINEEDSLTGELAKFDMDKEKAKKMIEFMKKEKVYDAFTGLFSQKRDLLTKYAKNLGAYTPDDSEKTDKEQSAIQKRMTQIAQDLIKQNPNIKPKELKKLVADKFLEQPKVKDAIKKDPDPEAKEEKVKEKVEQTIANDPTFFQSRSEKELSDKQSPFLNQAYSIIKSDLRYQNKQNKIESISKGIIQDLFGDLGTVDETELEVWPPKSKGIFKKFVEDQGGAKSLYEKMKNKFDWFDGNEVKFVLLEFPNNYHAVSLESFLKKDFFEKNLVDKEGKTKDTPTFAPPPPTQTEQLIANKLKSLIREMLNKGK